MNQGRRSPWPLHPWPKDDELFLSWLVRFAEANRVTPRRLLAWVARTPVTRLVLSDVLYADHLHAFSVISGVPPLRLSQMIPDQGGLEVHQRALDVPYRCCPQCLASDDDPYLRRSWVLPETLVCIEHRTPLSRRCAYCYTPWGTHALGRPDRPQASDKRQCPVASCGRPVIDSDFGTLGADHGVMWLQGQLSDPDRQGLATLPTGTTVQRAVLHDVLSSLTFWPLRQAMLPFEVDAGLILDRDVGPRQATYPWLMFAQLLQLPAWFGSELLTSLAEDLASVTIGRSVPWHWQSRKLLSEPDELKAFLRSCQGQAQLLKFFHLVHDPQVQIIDQRVLRSLRSVDVLMPHQQVFGQELEFVLSLLNQLKATQDMPTDVR